MDFHRPQPQTLNHHLNFDVQSQDTKHEKEAFKSGPEAVDWASEEGKYDNRFGNVQWERRDPCEEAHGTYYYRKQNKVPFFTQREVKRNNDDEDPLYKQLPEAAYWRGTPTSNLLVPDKFAGDVVDGYDTEAWKMPQSQPKLRRKNFRDNHTWGVAMNAVPALLQKVKITKS